MDVSATFTDNNELVRVVDVDVNGSSIYVTYVTSASNLDVKQMFLVTGQSSTTIATSATVN